MSNPYRLSRRTVLRTLGSIGTAPLALSAGVGAVRNESASERARAAGSVPEDATLYLGVVDRIVDDRHVVVLLEDGDRVVDQLVVPVDRFDGIESGAAILAVVADDELLAYRRLPTKPGDPPEPEFERL